MNKSIEEALRRILDKMEVPENRKDVGLLDNLLWLHRNLGIKNGKSGEYNTAKHFINHLLYLRNE